jgi:dinuclear metal center YbgI/SA1388 family protein
MNWASSSLFFLRAAIASAAYGAIPYGATVAARDDIVDYLDDMLEASAWQDYGPNGLQVPGAATVTKIVTAVSAHQELFERAAAAGAQLALCHHGIFWGGPLGPIDERMKRRLKTLFDNDTSLVAYHLPLDAHAEVGNNALICAALGFDRAEPFAVHGGRAIGRVGRVDDAITIGELLDRCARAFERDDVLHFPGGPSMIGSIGVVSGGGAKDLAEAATLGLDAFLTGEPSEPAMADARELGVHFLAAGHWATETFGIRRLGELVAERFGVEHEFVALRNPV